MVDENEFRERMGRFETMGSQIESLGEQLDYVKGIINEHDEAEELMKRFKDQGEDTEVLVPAGANSHIYCKVGRSDKVLIGLGSNISAETDVESAADIIERRKKELLSTKTELESGLNKLEQEYQQLGEALQKEYQELQMQGQQE